MTDAGSIFASKELLDMISQPNSKISVDPMHSAVVNIGKKSYNCAITNILLSDFLIEIVISMDPASSVEALRSSLGRNMTIPDILPGLGTCIVSQVEMRQNYEIKLTAARANS